MLSLTHFKTVIGSCMLSNFHSLQIHCALNVVNNFGDKSFFKLKNANHIEENEKIPGRQRMLFKGKLVFIVISNDIW